MPLDCLALGTHQSMFVFQPANLAKGLTAKNARFPLVPLRQYRPNQTVLGRRLDLAQALLATVLTLRPLRAAFYLKAWLTEDGGEGEGNAKRASSSWPEALPLLFSLWGRSVADGDQLCQLKKRQVRQAP